MTSDFAAGFPVVCLGGAAADIDSYIGLVRNLPDDLGIAVFIINYMKNVARVLREDLPRYTKMQVKLIEEGLLIQPNHVYIIEQEREVHVLDGKFNLKAISKPTGWPDVVTVTLISLTRSWCGQIMAVILSGYDGDGADALCAIKEKGGIIFAQKVGRAEQPDMPNSAISTGCVDFILTVEEIAMEIERISRLGNRRLGHPHIIDLPSNVHLGNGGR
jgi:two-component system chemotaxis response regulator CheB